MKKSAEFAGVPLGVSLAISIFICAGTEIFGQAAMADAFNDGVQAYNHKNYKQSAQIFDQVTKSSPNNSSAMYYAAIAHQAAGDINTAKKYYKNIVSKFPNTQAAQLAAQALGLGQSAGRNSNTSGASEQAQYDSELARIMSDGDARSNQIQAQIDNLKRQGAPERLIQHLRDQQNSVRDSQIGSIEQEYNARFHQIQTKIDALETSLNATNNPDEIQSLQQQARSLLAEQETLSVDKLQKQKSIYEAQGDTAKAKLTQTQIDLFKGK